MYIDGECIRLILNTFWVYSQHLRLPLNSMYITFTFSKASSMLWLPAATFVITWVCSNFDSRFPSGEASLKAINYSSRTQSVPFFFILTLLKLRRSWMPLAAIRDLHCTSGRRESLTFLRGRHRRNFWLPSLVREHFSLWSSPGVMPWRRDLRMMVWSRHNVRCCTLELLRKKKCWIGIFWLLLKLRDTEVLFRRMPIYHENQ